MDSIVGSMMVMVYAVGGFVGVGAVLTALYLWFVRSNQFKGS